MNGKHYKNRSLSALPIKPESKGRRSRGSDPSDRIERMDSVAVLVNNRLLVPLRHISNYLDCEVSWDESAALPMFLRGQSKEEIKELMEKPATLY